MLTGERTGKALPPPGETVAANLAAISIEFSALGVLDGTSSPSEAIPVRKIALTKVKRRPTLEEVRKVKGKYRNVLSPTEEFLAQKRLDLELES